MVEIRRSILTLLPLGLVLLLVGVVVAGEYMDRADSLDRAGDLDAAAAAYREAYSVDESNLEALMGLADVSVRSGNLGTAAQALMQVIERDQTYTEAYLELARIGWLTGDLEQARQYVDLADTVATSPNPKIPAYRSVILRGMGRVREADSVIEAAARRFPDSPIIEANLALIKALAESPEIGFQHAYKALSLDPTRVQTLITLASMYFAAGDLDSAKHYYQLAAERDPENVMVRDGLAQFDSLSVEMQLHKLMREGVGYFDRALYSKARKSFSQAIELDSTFFEAYLNLGFTLNLVGEPGRAAEVFRKASQLNSEDAPLYIGWGNALAGLGKFDEAIVKYERAIELDSTIQEVHQALETVRMLKERQAEEAEGEER